MMIRVGLLIVVILWVSVMLTYAAVLSKRFKTFKKYDQDGWWLDSEKGGKDNGRRSSMRNGSG